jgi:hypothetical protein
VKKPHGEWMLIQLNGDQFVASFLGVLGDCGEESYFWEGFVKIKNGNI